jgi:hypothetical protein
MIERAVWILVTLCAYYAGYRRGKSWWKRSFDKPMDHDEARIIHGLEKTIEPNRPRLRFDRKDG